MSKEREARSLLAHFILDQRNYVRALRHTVATETGRTTSFYHVMDAYIDEALAGLTRFRALARVMRGVDNI